VEVAVSSWFKGRFLEGVIEGLLTEGQYTVHKTGWEYRYPDLLGIAQVVPAALRQLPDLLIEGTQHGPLWAEIRYRREWSCYGLYDQLVAGEKQFPVGTKRIVIHGCSTSINVDTPGLWVIPSWDEKEKSVNFKHFFPQVPAHLITKTLDFLALLIKAADEMGIDAEGLLSGSE
jgi:hypothetical protein